MPKKITKKTTPAKKTIKKYGDGGKNGKSSTPVDATKDDFIQYLLDKQAFDAWRWGRGSQDESIGYMGISQRPQAKAGAIFQRGVDAARNLAKNLGLQRKGGKVKSKSTTLKKKK